VKCRTLRSFSDMTYYSAPSGAGVFATGTNWWVSKFSAPCIDGSCPHNEVVIRVTTNVLKAFGVGPAGVAHPSTATKLSQLPVDTTPDGPTTTVRRRPSTGGTSTTTPSTKTTSKTTKPTSTRSTGGTSPAAPAGP
jgi:hypothetical protein